MRAITKNGAVTAAARAQALLERGSLGPESAVQASRIGGSVIKIGFAARDRA